MITLLVFIIPAISIAKLYIRSFENGYIVKLQALTDNYDWLKSFNSIWYQICDLDNVDKYLIGLFLGTDPLIAFKIIFLFCLGNYSLMLTKYGYQEPHPFWVDNRITVPHYFCDS